MTEHVWLIDGRVRRGSGESAAREAAILAGDGLFETLLVRAGQPVDLTAHLDRLRLSLEQRDWLREAPPEAVASGVEQLASACPGERVRLRVAVGDAGRGAEIVASATTHVLPDAAVDVALMAGADGRVSSSDPYRRHKTLSWRRAAAALLAGHAGCYDVLVLNERGGVAEGARSNVVVRHAGRTFTPPLSEGCLPGTVRRRLLETSAVQEAPVQPEILTAGAELVLTNSLVGALAVGRVGATSLPVAGLAAELQEVLGR